MGYSKQKFSMFIAIFSMIYMVGTPAAYALSATLSGPYGGCANFDLKVSFDAAVAGFEEQDLVMVNAIAGPAVGGPLEFIVPITAMGEGVFIELPSDSVFNESFEGNTQSNLFMYASRIWKRGTQTGSFDLTLTFSEEVRGLELGDFILSAGSLTELTGGPVVYSLTVTPPAESVGTLQVDLPTGSAQDLCGNLSVAAPQTCVPFNTEKKELPPADLENDLNLKQNESLEPKVPGVPVLGLPGLAALAALLGIAGARGAGRKK